MITKLENSKIAIIGLGYVGLPLAAAFAEKYKTVGYDINPTRVDQLQKGHDRTLEVADEELRKVLVLTGQELDEKGKGLLITDAIMPVSTANIYIVTVPTPTDKHNRPVLTPMIKASEMIAKVLKKGDVECVPVLENISGLKYNEDFFAGYSPERINPGDKEHTVTKILKVTSGSTPEVAEYVDQLYKTVITAGTHKASSIKVAEAAKVIENSQRDINIAFVNELSKIFNLMGVDTQEVLEAAGTRWNFLPFRPGLVGGHCISVDPFYLAQKAQEMGYHPEIILAGRRLNDSMGKHVATEVIKLMMRKDLKVIDSKVLILGFTFKEDCPDVRNTRVIDIYNELRSFDMDVCVYDPWADAAEVKHEYGIEILNAGEKPMLEDYSAVILAVGHKEFKTWDIKKSDQQVVFDVKSVLRKDLVDARL